MSRPKITTTQAAPDLEAAEKLKAALAPSSGGPHDPETRRLRARVALLEQQMTTLLTRMGVKWVVAPPPQH